MRPALIAGWVLASMLTLVVWPDGARGDARGVRLGYHGESHRDAIERVQRFLEIHLGSAHTGGDSEVYALVPAIREPPASTWIVDPEQPGPDRPPTGRSLFDVLFVAQTRDGPVYDLPFPFARLLHRLEAPSSGEGKRQPILKRALIPYGRSLQRHAAAPEYFKFPRMVVAVDTEPASTSGPHAPVMVKDRLFLGYQEKSGIIEVISYNEQAARFEFQVVSDYAPGKTPRIAYARRAICTSCHQNGAPLFSEAGWDETNTNTRVADALAVVQSNFYGLSVDRCCAESPAAIDNATDRANLFSAYQLLWRDACRDPATGHLSVPCRGAALTAMLQHRLSAFSHFDTESSAYRDDFLPAFTGNWRARWPDGLNVPNPNIPNRKPLLSPRPAHISAELDPLKIRAPLAVWKVHVTRDRRRMITGFAEFLPESDVLRLDAHLYRSAVDAGAARRRLSRRCPVSRQTLLGGAELLVVRCVDEAGQPSGPFELLADLVYDGDQSMRGSLVRLELAEGELFTNIHLPAAAVGRRAASRLARLELLERRHRTRVRRADGNAIAVFELAWEHGTEEGEAQARVTLEVIDDFAPVHAALARLKSDDASILASEAPFRGTRAMDELLAALGLAPTGWCCDALPPMPPIRIADEAEGGMHARAPPAGASSVPAAFYTRCASCHRGQARMPPGFMRGAPHEVAGNVSECAQRIYVRLGMWGIEEPARAKSPMPPHASLSPVHDTWAGGDEYRRMLDYVSGVLAARHGARPDLGTLLDEGYENLEDCRPHTG